MDEYKDHMLKSPPVYKMIPQLKNRDCPSEIGQWISIKFHI